MLSTAFLVRWTSQARFTQETTGIDWYSTVTIFHGIDRDRAIAYQASIEGLTGNAVPLTSYGLRAIYRKRISREWLSVEMRAGADWPRQLVVEQRNLNWGLGVALELQFGPEELSATHGAVH